MPQSPENGRTICQTTQVILNVFSYIEAHKIQKQVQEMEKTEKEAYLKSRQEKIEIGLAQERKKQAIELTALRARSQTA